MLPNRHAAALGAKVDADDCGHGCVCVCVIVFVCVCVEGM